jgi:hypothetical protein
MGLQLPTKVSEEQNTVSPGLHTEQQQAQVDCRRARTQGRGMTDADVRGEFALETIHVRAERRDPVGLEGVLDKGGFLVAQVRRRQPDALRKFATRNEIDQAAICSDYGNVVEQVLIHQFHQPRGGISLAGANRLVGRQG